MARRTRTATPASATDPAPVAPTVAADAASDAPAPDITPEPVPAADATTAPDAAATAPDTDTAPDTPTSDVTPEPVPAADEASDTDTPTTPTPVPTVPVLTPEAMAEAMKILAGEAERHAAAEVELDKIAAEEEARRQKIQADLAKARMLEETRAALGSLLAAVTAAYLAVTNADEAAVGPGLEAVNVATDGVRRALRVTAPRSSRTNSGGATVRSDKAAPRPLRPEVAAHLAAYPDGDFTPGEIGKVLGRSSGAVANALDKLVELGEATLTSEKPHRYRMATPATTPAPAIGNVTTVEAPATSADAA